MKLILKNKYTNEIMGKFTATKKKFFFEYIDPYKRNPNFGTFPGFDDLNRIYESQNLFMNIDARLPNRERPDWNQITSEIGVNSKASNIEILEKTGGELFTDHYIFEKDISFEHAKDKVISNQKLDNSDLSLLTTIEVSALKVFELRKKKNITQAALAKMIGNTNTCISRLENGVYNPTIELLDKIAKALNSKLVISFN